jgi:hypothetical protein
MAWWFDRDNKCTYEEWVERAGGLLKWLDTVCSKAKFETILELGTGNSTRALARHCGRVVTIDENSFAVTVPVAEQGPSGLKREYWDELKKEDNVTFLCGDILTMDLSELRKYKFDAVLFDLGSTYADKYLYRLAHGRLMNEGILQEDITILADNAEDAFVVDFAKYLSGIYGYHVTDFGQQFIATKKESNDTR